MCGFIYNVNDFPLLEPLLDIAGYDEQEIRDIIRQQYLRPTDTVINMVPSRTGPRLLGATWWLATHPDGSVNTRYSTFNSKAGKLTSSPLHTQKPRSIRSIIPASGFCEWQPIFKGDHLYTDILGDSQPAQLPPIARKQQCLIQQTDTSLMLLASVSKLRLDKEGLPRVNTSVITLPPHREFLDIHHKSFPLILNLSEIEQWLDPTIPTSEFNELLHQTTFRQDFTVTQVNEKCQPVSDTIVQFKARKPS
jgi:putative SOS response-associated peptidase YedK